MVRNKRKISADQYFYWEGAPGHLLVFLPGPYFKNFVLTLYLGDQRYGVSSRNFRLQEQETTACNILLLGTCQLHA